MKDRAWLETILTDTLSIQRHRETRSRKSTPMSICVLTHIKPPQHHHKGKHPESTTATKKNTKCLFGPHMKSRPNPDTRHNSHDENPAEEMDALLREIDITRGLNNQTAPMPSEGPKSRAKKRCHFGPRKHKEEPQRTPNADANPRTMKLTPRQLTTPITLCNKRRVTMNHT